MSNRIPFFSPEDYEGHKPPVDVEPVPTKRGSKRFVRVGSILNWLMTGQLGPYSNNRGNCLVAGGTVKSILEKGLIADVLGEMTVGYRNGKLTLADWHGRAYGALRRYMNGDMTSNELDIFVSCSVAQDFMRAYITLNMANVHNAKDRSSNPDLTYGILGRHVFPQLSIACMQAASNKFSMMGTIAYALTELRTSDPNQWTFSRVYTLRTKATKLQNEKLGTLQLSKAQYARFADAIEDWYEFCRAYTAAAGVLDVTEVTNSTGFFGYFVTNRLSQPQGLNDKQSIMVRRAIKHFGHLCLNAPKLMHGKYAEIEDKCRIFDEIFNGKKRGAPKKKKIFMLS